MEGRKLRSNHGLITTENGENRPNSNASRFRRAPFIRTDERIQKC